MLECDHIGQQSHQTIDLRQWHRRKILTERMKAMLLYRTPIQAKNEEFIKIIFVKMV